MKRFAIFTLVAMLCSVFGFAETTGRLEAFPGAEGYGRYTSGGRGGAVYHVTTLEDNNDPGSLRYAVSQSGPRTIIFDVSGTIHLNSELKLTNGNITIAGQTAPGDGICIADYPFTISANNVIIRFIRFRLGNKNATVGGADGWDALGCLDHKHIIVDHCSVSWSLDECLSFSGTSYTTVQWCIVSHSLVHSGHSKGNHGYGGNWGGEYASYHHNLMAHHTSRAPRLGPRPSTQLKEYMDMRNNVIYNYSGEGCYGGEGMNVNIVNNYYIPGPGNKYVNATGSTAYKASRIAGIGVRNNAYIATYPTYVDALHKVGTYYIDGNENKSKSAVNTDNWNQGVYNQITWSDWDDLANSEAKRNALKEQMKLDKPIEFEYTTTHTTQNAYAAVINFAGACQMTGFAPTRDAYDATILANAKAATGTMGTGDEYNDAGTLTGSKMGAGFINTVDDIVYPSSYKAGVDYDATTKLPILNSTAAPKDTDGDGMPDDYETKNGLNPNDPSDGALRSKSGFTNLEVYLNSLVQTLMDRCVANGKMLNGQLTYNDAAVTLPTFDVNLYNPAEDPVNDNSVNTYVPGGSGDGDEEETEPGKISVNAARETSFEANATLYEDENIKVATYYATTGGGDGKAYVYPDGQSFLGWIEIRGKAPSADNPAGEMDTKTPIIITVKNPMTLTAYLRTGSNKLTAVNMYNQADPSTALSKTDDSLVDETSTSNSFWQFGWTLPVGTYTLTEISGTGRLSGFYYELDGNSGIEDIVVEPTQPKGNGKIYNIMGVEVKEPLLPGIYIRDGKKFLVK